MEKIARFCMLEEYKRIKAYESATAISGKQKQKEILKAGSAKQTLKKKQRMKEVGEYLKLGVDRKQVAEIIGVNLNTINAYIREMGA